MTIQLTEAQTKRMLKVKSLLEDMFDNGKLHGLTPCCVRDMASCYNEIIQSIEHYGMTMFEEVASVFKKYGFRVETINIPGSILHYHVHILTEKQEMKLKNK